MDGSFKPRMERDQVHKYGPEMHELYRRGDGFIFETLVSWARPQRKRYTQNALERIHAYAKRIGKEPEQLQILMLGDGTGNDSLYLIKNGLNLHYYDVPESKVFAFAVKRFQAYDLIGRKVTIIWVRLFGSDWLVGAVQEGMTPPR